MPPSYDVIVSASATVMPTGAKVEAGAMLGARKPVATRAYTLTSRFSLYVVDRSQLTLSLLSLTLFGPTGVKPIAVTVLKSFLSSV